MSQLFLFVMSLVGEIYLLIASALLSPNAVVGHRRIYPRCDCSLPLQQERSSKAYLAVHGDVFKNVLDFLEAACCLQIVCMSLKKRGTSIHVTGLHPCLTGKSQLLYAGVRGDSPWIFPEFLYVFSILYACSYRFLSKLHCINNIMLYNAFKVHLFFKVSLSLCYFVQPFLGLLSTIIVCNMSSVKRNMPYFRQLLFTVLELQAPTQNHNNVSIYNLK